MEADNNKMASVGLSTDAWSTERGNYGAERRLQLARWMPMLLVIGMLALIGCIAGILVHVRPVTQTHLIPIWVDPPTNRLAPLNGPVENDLFAIWDPNLFVNCELDGRQACTQRTVADRLNQLAALGRDASAVVYISGVAFLDAGQHLVLASADSSTTSHFDGPRLDLILEAVQSAEVKCKLIVLDLFYDPLPVNIQTESLGLHVAIERALSKFESEGTNVLLSCSKGETGHLIWSPRRSLFGYFVERGLRGDADGFGKHSRDGRVESDELSDYLAHTVSEYSQLVFSTRQTPCRIDQHRGFQLVTCPDTSWDAKASNASLVSDDTDYPKWLAEHWQLARELAGSCTSDQELKQLVGYEQRLIRAERNWLSGRDPEQDIVGLSRLASKFPGAEQLQPVNLPSNLSVGHSTTNHLKAAADGASAAKAEDDQSGGDATSSRSASSGKSTNDQPDKDVAPSDSDASHPESVAGSFLVAYSKDSPVRLRRQLSTYLIDQTERAELDAEVRAWLAELQETVDSVPPDKRSAAIAKINQRFLQQVEPDNHAATFYHIYRLAGEDGAFALDLLPHVLSVIEKFELPLKLKLFQTILAKVAEEFAINSPTERRIEQTRGLLRIIASSENRPSDPRIIAWTDANRQQFDELRYLCETLYWNPECTRESTLQEYLHQAGASRLQLRVVEQRMAEAYRTLFAARRTLPQLLPVLVSLPHLEENWKRAIATTVELKKTLVQEDTRLETGGQRKSSPVSRVTDLTHQLEAELDYLMRFTDVDLHHQVLDEAWNGSTAQSNLEQIATILSTPFVSAEERICLQQSADELSRRIHQQAVESLSRNSARSRYAASSLTQATSTAKRKWGKQLSAALQRIQIEANDPIPESHPPHEQRLCDLYARLAEYSPYASLYQNRINALTQSASSSGALVTQTTPGSIVATLDNGRRVERLTLPLPRQLASSDTEDVPSQATSAGANLPGEYDLQAVLIPNALDALELTFTSKSQEQSRSEISLDLRLTERLEIAAATHAPAIFVATKRGNRGRLQRIELPGLMREPNVEVSLLPVGEKLRDGQVSHSVRLRPNGLHQPFQLWLRSTFPSEREINVRVDDQTTTTILSPGQPTKVAFPGKPPKADQELPRLTTPLSIAIHDAGSKELIDSVEVAIEVAEPREYVEVVAARFTPFASTRNLLEVWLRTKAVALDTPVTAELRLDQETVPGLKSLSGGRLKAELDPDGGPTRLYAEDLIMSEHTHETGQFTLAIDGVEQAFTFNAELSAQGGVTQPVLVTTPILRLSAEESGLAGASLPVSIRVGNSPSRASLGLTFSKQDSGTHPDIDKTLETPRRTTIGFEPATNGAFLFSGRLSDWDLQLDASNLVGRRWLAAKLQLGDRQLAETGMQVALDDQPPNYLRFIDLAPRLEIDADHTLKIEARSKLTGISTVGLYVGELHEGQLPADAQLLAAHRCLGSGDRLWQVEWHSDKKPGRVKIHAVARNGAALTTIESREVELLTAAALDSGTIAGAVFEGAVRQPGLPIELLKPDGSLQTKTRSDSFGRYEFTEVPSGEYQLRASKSATGRSARKGVRVRRDQVTSAQLSLEL